MVEHEKGFIPNQKKKINYSVNDPDRSTYVFV